MDAARASDTISSLQQQVHGWSLEQWKEEGPKLTSDQISTILPLITEEYEPNQWRDKLKNLISCLEEREKLEALGRSMDIHQILEVLTIAARGDKKIQSKLTPLFVGMPQQMFRLMLKNVTPEHLKLLKQEAVTEAIQHHLTRTTHEFQANLESAMSALEAQEKKILTLPIETIGRKEIDTMMEMVQKTSQDLMGLLQEINITLAIAWNTHRLDLIEQLSQTKEYCQRTLKQVIGSPQSSSNHATGIWSLLEKRLNSVFEEGERVFDDEPATEALVKFSVWYLEDYWKIGLLPMQAGSEELDLDPTTHSEQERLNYRDSLFKTAENNLEQLGLKTLKDLKKAHIYSKKGLIEYIQAHTL